MFLCPEASSDVAQPISDPLLDDIKPLIAPLVEKFLSPRFKKGKPTPKILFADVLSLKKNFLSFHSIQNHPSNIPTVQHNEI